MPYASMKDTILSCLPSAHQATEFLKLSSRSGYGYAGCRLNQHSWERSWALLTLIRVEDPEDVRAAYKDHLAYLSRLPACDIVPHARTSWKRELP